MTILNTRCSDELVIDAFGDIHLGHPVCPTPHIVKNLRGAWRESADLEKVDILLYNGDVFDRLLPYSNEFLFEIESWAMHTLRLCKKYGIALRILAGTPRHDNHQSTVFERLNETAEIGADLKYVKTLSIEYIERYGITVLYVPDEINHETHTTLSQVHELLKAKGLNQVDYAFMHGAFDYQLPEIASDHKHDTQAYLAIVRKAIIISHIHKFSRFERIVAPGSFDRLCHGEEEPKGHVRLTVRGDDVDVQFVENVNAMKFITVDCTGLEMEDLLEKVDKVAFGLPPASRVRIKAEADHPIFTSMENLIRRHPLVDWDKKKIVSEEDQKVFVIDEEDVYRPIALTKENLGELLMARVAAASLPADVLGYAREIMQEVL